MDHPVKFATRKHRAMGHGARSAVSYTTCLFYVTLVLKVCQLYGNANNISVKISVCDHFGAFDA